jgi:hypothetical protein
MIYVTDDNGGFSAERVEAASGSALGCALCC